MSVFKGQYSVIFSLLIFSGGLVIPGHVFAVDQDNKLDVLKINESFYILTETSRPTGLSSVGVSIGEDGLVVVDSLSTQESEKLLNTIHDLSDKPVKYVFNTFVQDSRTGANNNFRELGAKIIRASDEYPVWKDPNEAEADISFDKKLTLLFNNERIVATRFRIHTLGDSLIYFDKSNVLFMGRTYLSQLLPTFINFEKQMAIYEYALNLADENTVIVPANGKLSNKEALKTYKETLDELISLVLHLDSSNHSLEEIMNDRQVADLVNRISIRFESDNPAFRNAERWFLGTLVNSILFNKNSDKTTKLPADILQSYTGKYQFAREDVVDVFNLDEQLMIGNLRADIQYIYELTPLAENEFVIVETGARYIFNRNQSGEIARLRREWRGEISQAEKN